MEITMEKKYYVYAYLDPRENGEYNFGNYSFKNKPFYIGKGKDGSNRLEKHLKLIKEQNKDIYNLTKISGKLQVISEEKDWDRLADINETLLTVDTETLIQKLHDQTKDGD